MAIEQIKIRGLAYWNYLNGKVNEYNGSETGYETSIYVSDKELARVKAELDRVLEEVKNDPDWVNAKKQKPTSWDGLSSSPIKEDKDGKEFIRVKTNHLDKEGKRRYLKIYNRFGRLPQEQEENFKLNNGSEVIVAFLPRVYWNNKRTHGIATFITGVQVLKEASSIVDPDFEFESPLDTEEEIPV